MNEKAVSAAEIFARSFSEHKQDSFVIYGLGPGTKEILEQAAGFRILGLLDGFRESGVCFGKRILSLQEVANLQPARIVIVARANSTKIIAKRMEAFCREHQIGLYDVNGADLLQKKRVALQDQPYFHVTAGSLRAAIKAQDVVSFDVFDTLLMRKTLYPDDVFALMERRIGLPGFSKARQQAEHTLYASGKQPDFAEIYALLSGIFPSAAGLEKKLQKIELEIERQVLVPRREMVEIFRETVEMGKTVWLISDMYLSSKQISALLRHCGIDGWSRLFVSSAYGMAKGNGLFEKIRQETGVKSWLHIGDNAEVDGEAASRQGVKPFLIQSAMGMAELSTWQEALSWPSNLEERLMLGMVLAGALNSPFALAGSQGKVRLQDGAMLGRTIFAPLLTALFCWLMEQTAGRYDVLLYGARDGYLLQKMQLLFAKTFPHASLPRPVYFYVSRLAAVAASLRTRADIEYAISIGFDGTAEEMLRKRFQLREAEILPRRGNSESDEIYLLRHEEIILRRARELRQNARRYYETLGLGPEDRIAFFDLVSSGTCQLCSEKIFSISLEGFYLIHILEDYAPKRQLTCRAYMEEAPLLALHSYLSTNYEPLETMVMSEEPTLVGFSPEGEPLFTTEKRTAEDISYLRELQHGVLAFFEDYIDILHVEKAVVSPQFADHLCQLMRKAFSEIEQCSLAEQVVPDDFTNREFVMRDMYD